VCLTVVQGSAWDSKDMADFDFGSDKESSSDEGKNNRVAKRILLVD
jgi:hypothetical protein